MRHGHRDIDRPIFVEALLISSVDFQILTNHFFSNRWRSLFCVFAKIVIQVARFHGVELGFLSSFRLVTLLLEEYICVGKMIKVFFHIYCFHYIKVIVIHLII
jgi:hypothetical protein